MPFIENHARLLRFLFAPFTPFYAGAVRFRNMLFNRGLKKSHAFDFPVICVGNLCAGGSGKTPLTEYIVRVLGQEFAVGIVSRGYGRQSKGNFLAKEGMNAERIGDEPVQYMQNFAAGGRQAAVCPHGFALYLAARRKEGVEALRSEFPAMQVCILDDAYQHRQVKAGLNILVSDVSKPFFRDHLLPCGTLRESCKESRRAQIVVFGKCPSDWREQDRDAFLSAWKPAPHQQVFFTTIKYGDFVQIDTSSGTPIAPASLPHRVILFTGIANAAPLEAHLRRQGYHIVEHHRFGDHHTYTPQEAQALAERARYLAIQGAPPLLLTTQKDYCRLKDTAAFAYFCQLPLAYIPIQTEFLFGQGGAFDHAVRDFVHTQRAHSTQSGNHNHKK